MNGRRMATVVAAVALLGVVGGIALAASIGHPPTPVAPVGHTLSGPCDEPEHAGDPRCDGPQRLEDDVRATPTPHASSSTPPTAEATARAAEDVSGPCDEAEHANDPRCTGLDDDDHRGRNRGPGSDDHDHDDDDDRDDDDGDDDDGDDDDRDDDRSGSDRG